MHALASPVSSEYSRSSRERAADSRRHQASSMHILRSTVLVIAIVIAPCDFDCFVSVS
jgi:hypothetical protein